MMAMCVSGVDIVMKSIIGNFLNNPCYSCRLLIEVFLHMMHNFYVYIIIQNLKALVVIVVNKLYLMLILNKICYYLPKLRKLYRKYLRDSV